MSEIITRTVVELEQLGAYHKLNKAYIDAGLAKKWESATFDEDTRTVSFYTVPQPSGDVEPAYTFTLPKVDFTEIYNMIDALEGKVDKNAEDITGLRTDIDAINNAETGILKQAKDYADEKAKVNADAIDALEGRADVVESTVAKLDGDDTVEGSVKAQIKAAKEELVGNIATTQEELDTLEEKVDGMYTNEQIDTAVADAKKAGTDAQDAVDALSETHVADKKTLEDAIALKADQTALQSEVNRATGEETRIEGLVTAETQRATEAEAGLNERLVEVETFFKTAEDETIDQAMDTLVEIQKYITEDGAAADQMVKDISANAKAIEDEVARATGVEGGLDKRLQSVETAIGEGGSVETQITDAIGELDADVKSADVETGTGVQVQVTEVDGKVTTVTVTGNYDNTYDAKGNAAQALVDAKAYVNEKDTAMDARVDVVEAAIGENGSVTTAIAEAQADADSALEQIAAVSYATTEQIQALWTTE